MIKQLVSLGMVGVMVLSAVVLSLSPITAAKENNDPKDSSDNGNSVTCDDITGGLGYETKVETTGDPASVPYTAPEGKLVAAYCVKAGTTAEIVEVTPPQASIDIVAPNEKDVSHYQVLLVDEEVVPTLASVTYRIVPANCEAPASLFYSYQNAFLGDQIEVDYIEDMTSLQLFVAELPAETEITGPASVELLFIAEKGAEFENGETTFVIEEELEGQLTGEQCVLGEEPEEPVTPVTPETPEVLPETNGSTAAVVASIIAGVTALIALMGTSVRSLFGRSL